MFLWKSPPHDLTSEHLWLLENSNEFPTYFLSDQCAEIKNLKLRKDIKRDGWEGLFSLGAKPLPPSAAPPKKHCISSKVLNSFNDFSIDEFNKPKLKSFLKVDKQKTKIYNVLDHSSATVQPASHLEEK